MPVGAEIAAEADVEIESISADDVMTQMQSAGNAVNLVFLDACRNNPLARTSRSATRGLARLDAPRGSFVGYSTAPGDVAADGDGANSPYALALAEELKKPGISIEEAHRNVRAKVLAESGNKQTPWDSSSLTGPVVLAAKAPEPVPAQQPAVNNEALFWESIKDGDDAAEFEAYLAQYPQGSFAGLAKAKIAKLSKASEPAPAQQVTIATPDVAILAKQQEFDFWNRIKTSMNVGDYQGYLAKYPAGVFAPLAKSKIDALTAPPPPTQGASTAPAILNVPAEVQSQIEQYLRNSQATARVWAFAIAKDGSSGAAASCPTTGYSGGNACFASMGGPQDLAKKEAIKKCGGSGKCMLLYDGNRKVANLDIVVQ